MGMLLSRRYRNNTAPSKMTSKESLKEDKPKVPSKGKKPSKKKTEGVEENEQG